MKGVTIYVFLRLCFIIPSFANEFLDDVLMMTRPDTVGSFNLQMTKFDVCKGPKKKECARAIGTIKEMYLLDYDMEVTENVRTTKGKIVVYSKGKETLRLQVKDPCQHLFLKPLLQSMLNATKDCLIAKGHYHFRLDIQEVARKYYAGEFLFGTWTFKSLFYNDYCNFSCSIVEVNIVPKNKT